MTVDGRIAKIKVSGMPRRKPNMSPCSVCSEVKPPLRKGKCHRCNEYLRRNGVDWKPDPRKPSILTDANCDEIISCPRGEIQDVAEKLGISRSYAYVIRFKGKPVKCS
jgi:hypothetical protein